MAHLYQIVLKPVTTKYPGTQSFLVVAGDAFEAERIGHKQIEEGGWSELYKFGSRHWIADLGKATNGDVFNIVG